MRAVCEREPGSGGIAAEPGFHWTVLQRFGKRPLAVMGRVLLRADNRCAGLICWSELTIHETVGLRFAASIRHERAGAEGWRDAWLCDSADAVRIVVLAHDPLQALPPETAGPRAFRSAWVGLVAAVFGARRQLAT